MSKCVKDSLYYSESYDDEDADTDIWDDRKLNDAYDKALRMANAEVAKRVAMSTNSDHKNKEGQKDKPMAKTNSKSNKKTANTQWKPGMHCRAVYEVDGLEYEACILRIINENECILRFLGYDNSEVVPIRTLKPSLGKEVRDRQIAQALDDKIDEAYTSQSPGTEKMDYSSDRAPSTGSTERSFCNSKKATKKKKNHNNRISNGFDLPNMPFPMPNVAALRSLGSMEMPLPPPPLLGALGGDGEDQALSSMLLAWYMSGYYTGLYQGLKRDGEDQALSSMLLAWYMSGYYTGLYQGLKRAKVNRRNI